MLLDSIKSDIQESLKKGDTVRLGTLRFLLAGIRNTAIAKYGNQGEAAMTDPDILEVIKKQAKTHKESVEAYSKAGRTDLVQKEQAELDILLTFLPKELSDEDLRTILIPLSQSGEKNFGLLMKQAMQLVNGRAEGGRVSGILKSLIH